MVLEKKIGYKFSSFLRLEKICPSVLLLSFSREIKRRYFDMEALVEQYFSYFVEQYLHFPMSAKRCSVAGSGCKDDNLKLNLDCGCLSIRSRICGCNGKDCDIVAGSKCLSRDFA